MTSNNGKPKRTRRLGTLAVAEQCDSGDLRVIDTNVSFKASSEAVRWIRQNGQDCTTYRVIRLGSVVKVRKVTQTRLDIQ